MRERSAFVYHRPRWKTKREKEKDPECLNHLYGGEFNSLSRKNYIGFTNASRREGIMKNIRGMRVVVGSVVRRVHNDSLCWYARTYTPRAIVTGCFQSWIGRARKDNDGHNQRSRHTEPQHFKPAGQPNTLPEIR